uniref:Large ribosomal subunit protein uL15/eL18 domain-containing protein n=1 Tax=Cucumis melo TaxID=3656 RepID=A0A9I9D2Q2_CUCME
MAALFSLSSTSLTRTATALPYPTTSFKGNVSILNSKHLSISSPKLKFKAVDGKHLVVRNQAAASSLYASPADNVRFRLDNLGPQPGSRKRGKRKGRGISAGQGGSCGFGMRGQKSRSGPGVRKGFEGGQMPLYRRIPKLRGIAGDYGCFIEEYGCFIEGDSERSNFLFILIPKTSVPFIFTYLARAREKSSHSIVAHPSPSFLKRMHAGLPKYVPVNLKDIEEAGFQEGEEVSLETLKEKGLINPSGRERKLPLKILADGELSVKLNIKARAFSSAAKEKLEAAGCSLTVLPGRKKWVKPSVAKNLARAEEYFAKKKAAAAAAEQSSA